ncbi:MAG: hypothetical protein VXB01_15255 [Opitutae bacterium]
MANNNDHDKPNGNAFEAERFDQVQRPPLYYIKMIIYSGRDRLPDGLEEIVTGLLVGMASSPYLPVARSICNLV